MTNEQKCTAEAQHLAAACNLSTAPEDIAGSVTSCVTNYQSYAPIGCGEVWDAYTACLTVTQIDCTTGADGCASSLDAVFACNSEFAVRTGCSRSVSQDTRCSAAAPYAITCMGQPPSGCVDVASPVYCCTTLAP